MEAAGDGRGGGRADEDLKTRTPHNDVGNKPKKENVWELLGFSYDQTSLENIVFLFFLFPTCLTIHLSGKSAVVSRVG